MVLGIVVIEWIKFGYLEKNQNEQIKISYLHAEDEGYCLLSLFKKIEQRY
jgi:hypothetical protein